MYCWVGYPIFKTQILIVICRRYTNFIICELCIMRHVALLVVKFPNFLYPMAGAVHICKECFHLIQHFVLIFSIIENISSCRGNYLLMHDACYFTWYQYFQYPFLDSSSEKDWALTNAHLPNILLPNKQKWNHPQNIIVCSKLSINESVFTFNPKRKDLKERLV